MAANTLSAWSEDTLSMGNQKLYKATATCVIDTANAVAWTNKTPDNLDPKKPWVLIVSADTATDTQATPLGIYLGYGSNAALAGTASVTATNAVYFGQPLDDCCYTTPTVAKAIHFNPDQTVADVVTIAAVASGLKMKVPVVPYYLFNITAGSGTLLGATVTFTIIQIK